MGTRAIRKTDHNITHRSCNEKYRTEVSKWMAELFSKEEATWKWKQECTNFIDKLLSIAGAWGVWIFRLRTECYQNAVTTRWCSERRPVIEFAECVTNKHASAISIPSMRSFLNVISAWSGREDNLKTRNCRNCDIR